MQQELIRFYIYCEGTAGCICWTFGCEHMTERGAKDDSGTFGLTKRKKRELPLIETGNFTRESNKRVQWGEDWEFDLGPLKF